MFLLKKGKPPHFRMFQIKMHILGIWLSWPFQHFATTCHLKQQTSRIFCWSPGKPMIRWVVDNLSLSADDTLVVIYNPAWMSMKNFMYLAPTKNLHLFKQQIKHKKLPTFAVPSF